MDGTVHRLHRRVRKKRHLVDRVDLGHGSRHRLGHIAHVLRDRSRSERSFLQITRDILGAERRVRSVVPFNDQGRKPFLRRPHMVGHDGNRIVQPHDLPHTLDGLGCRVVDALQPAAEDRRLRERRDFEPRQFGIDSVDRRPVDLRRSVKALGRRADQLELLRAFERHLLRNRHLRRVAGKSAIFDPARARLMKDFAALRVTRGGIHLPALGGSCDQHGSGSRTGLAQGLPRRAYRVRVASGLQPTQQGVAVELLVGRSMFQPHLFQVHLQLFGDQHRDGGVGALSHLDIGHGQDDLPIASDADERVGRERRACGAFGCMSSPRPKADEEPSAQRRARTQELST